MSEDIFIKWLKDVWAFVQRNPVYTLVVVIVAAVSIYCLYKLLDKLRYG